MNFRKCYERKKAVLISTLKNSEFEAEPQLREKTVTVYCKNGTKCSSNKWKPKEIWDSYNNKNLFMIKRLYNASI